MRFAKRHYSFIAGSQAFVLASGLGKKPIDVAARSRAAIHRTDDFAGYAPFVEGMEPSRIDRHMSRVKGVDLVRVYEEARPGDIAVSAWIRPSVRHSHEVPILGVASVVALGALRGGHQVYVGDMNLAAGRPPGPTDLIGQFREDGGLDSQQLTHHRIVVTSGHWSIAEFARCVTRSLYGTNELVLVWCVRAGEMRSRAQVSVNDAGRQRTLAEPLCAVTRRHIDALSQSVETSARVNPVCLIFNDIDWLLKTAAHKLGGLLGGGDE